MDLSRCVNMSENERKYMQDGIHAVNLASAETGRNMWEVMKRDPNDPEITGATPAKYSRLFEENETKVNYRWQDLNGIYQNDWSFQARYPSFEIWAEGQETGFVFTTDSDFRLIGNNMKLIDSGCRYAETMRSLQYIATNGFDKFVDMMNGGPTPSRAATPVPEVAAVVPVVEIPPVHNRANTGGAMSRRVCKCRSQQGFKEGWCSFASMGQVPGCEY